MEIKDLILPDDFDKKRAKQELLDIYIEIYNTKKLTARELFSKYAISYINELNEIENKKPNYDREFWNKVKQLNKETLNYINTDILLTADCLIFENVKLPTLYYYHNEVDLINKQYRLLQEIYYSRLSK